MDHYYKFKDECLIKESNSHMAAYFRKFHSNFKSKNVRKFQGMYPALTSL